jgi:hypothetical protein
MAWDDLAKWQVEENKTASKTLSLFIRQIFS